MRDGEEDFLQSSSINYLGLDENIATKSYHAQVTEGKKEFDRDSFDDRCISSGEMKHALLDGDVTSYDLVCPTFIFFFSSQSIELIHLGSRFHTTSNR